MSEGPQTGGEPQTFGRCADCGEVYPVQRTENGLRPVGTGGACTCGCDDFESFGDE